MATQLLGIQRLAGNRAVMNLVNTNLQRRRAPLPRPVAKPLPAGRRVSKSQAPVRINLELKAWIPHRQVVDPEEPARAQDWLDLLDKPNELIEKYVPKMLRPSARFRYDFSSRYRGDGHKGYDGSHRVVGLVGFTWDGKRITDLTLKPLYGATHREWKQRAWIAIDVPFFSRKIMLVDRKGTETERASRSVVATTHGADFTMSIDSKNPLIMTYTPAIQSDLMGRIVNGNLSLSWRTTGFPSHGISILVDATQRLERVTNDASDIPALGLKGAAAIALALGRQNKRGAGTVRNL